MKYTITKVYKRRLDCDVEANSLEVALELARKSKHWKWDEEFPREKWFYIARYK